MFFLEIFPWNKNFDTGIELIDQQHKELVNILNRLATHLANNSEEVVLNDIFDELSSYANFHFKDEEKIWNKHFGDDDWNIEHQKTHGSFLGEIIEIKKNKDKKPLDDVVYEIVSFLSKWLAYHILDTDKRLAIAVREILSGVEKEEAKSIAIKEMNGSVKIIVETILNMYDTLSTRTLDLIREKALRQKAEENLKISEERFKLVIEGSTEDVWDWDVLENTIDRSSIEDIINLTNVHMNDTENSSIIHPSDIEYVKNDILAIINGKTNFYSNKHRLLHDDGSWSWVLSRGKVIERNSDGKALRMIGTNTDITERELASYIHKNSSQAMYICDSHKRIISVNPSFSMITGYSKEEAIGKEPSFLSLDNYDKDLSKQIFKTLNETGEWNGAISSNRKNRETFIKDIHASVVLDEKENIDHYIILFNDITEEEKQKEERKEQEEYLLHQSRMAQMGELISIIAHQWKQPLSIIASIATQIRMNYALETAVTLQEQEESAISIEKQIAYLTQTLDDFKDFLKPSKKKELTNITDIYDESINLIGNLIKDSGINISTDMNSQSSIEIYPKELLQVFINLFKNAVDAFEEREIKDKNLNITTNENDEYITIEVSDNAGGIKDEVVKTIFDPYITTKSEDNGTGLGLHICKTIVQKRLNGDIKAKNIDDGASFIITIPKV